MKKLIQDEELEEPARQQLSGWCQSTLAAHCTCAKIGDVAAFVAFSVHGSKANVPDYLARLQHLPSPLCPSGQPAAGGGHEHRRDCPVDGLR